MKILAILKETTGFPVISLYADEPISSVQLALEECIDIRYIQISPEGNRIDIYGNGTATMVRASVDKILETYLGVLPKYL